METNLVCNILERSKADSIIPDVVVVVVVGYSSHMDLVDMSDNAFDALVVANIRMDEDHIDMAAAVLVPNRHLLFDDEGQN
jgi:hypothetical protein